MVEIFLFSFAGIGLSAAAMAVGLLCGREPLRSGCASACEACEDPCALRRAAPGS